MGKSGEKGSEPVGIEANQLKENGLFIFDLRHLTKRKQITYFKFKILCFYDIKRIYTVLQKTE